MATTTKPTHSCPTTIQGVVGSSCDRCSYYVIMGENFKAKGMGEDF